MCICVSVLPVIVNGRLLPIVLSTALHRQSQSAARRRALQSPPSDLIDEADLSIPQITHAIEATRSIPRTVVVVRLKNETLVAVVDDATAHDDIRPLQIPIGHHTVSVLAQPNLHLVVLGLAGDCRALHRHLREVVVNHTVAIAAVPPLSSVAKAVGDYLQSHIHSPDRPLACHAFVFDTTPYRLLQPRPQVYEISPSGEVHAVCAGVAGRFSRALLSKLEAVVLDSSFARMNVSEVKDQVRQWVQELVNSSSTDSDQSVLDQAVHFLSFPDT
jgi:20S proteasome alpha/beta subunit